MKYNHQFIADGMEKLIETFKKDYDKAELEIDIEGGIFNNPDLLDLMDFLGDSGNKKYNDTMVRQCIINKTVSFTLDGENIGSIRLNNINDAWAVFPVLNDYPAAYKELADIVAVHLLKKSTLPRKKATNVPGAAEAIKR